MQNPLYHYLYASLYSGFYDFCSLVASSRIHCTVKRTNSVIVDSAKKDYLGTAKICLYNQSDSSS